MYQESILDYDVQKVYIIDMNVYGTIQGIGSKSGVFSTSQSRNLSPIAPQIAFKQLCCSKKESSLGDIVLLLLCSSFAQFSSLTLIATTSDKRL